MSAALKCIKDRDEDECLIDRALEILARRHARGEALTSPAATQAFLRLRLAGRNFETFGIIFAILAYTLMKRLVAILAYTLLPLAGR